MLEMILVTFFIIGSLLLGYKIGYEEGKKYGKRKEKKDES